MSQYKQYKQTMPEKNRDLTKIKMSKTETNVVSSATDEVVVTHLPLHPLISLTFFNGGSLFPWRLR